MAKTHSVTELGIVSGLFFRGDLALVFFFFYLFHSAAFSCYMHFALSFFPVCVDLKQEYKSLSPKPGWWNASSSVA